MKEEVELKELTGLHILSGVETGYMRDKRPYGEFENCNYIAFILDGKKYVAVEDPSDGYRSCMRYLKIGKGKLKNMIPDTQVFVFMGDISDYSRTKDVALFYATENAERVLAVGTSDSDDYYPSFVGHFIPENLPCNREG